jgi:hypothetical protein
MSQDSNSHPESKRPAPERQLDSATQERLKAGQECLDAALYYAELGLSALADCPPDHIGVGKKHGKECKSPGKAPWGEWKQFQERIASADELRQKWRDNPGLNVGMAYGPVSGLVGVDVDGPAGEEALARISGGNVPTTWEFETGGGGRRLLFRIPPGAELRTTSEPLAPGQEIRFQAKGAQTVMPPSRHVSGGRYRWKEDRGPGEIEPAVAPDWLLEQLKPTTETGARKGPAPAVGEAIQEGSRNSTLASLAGSMRRRGMSPDAIFAALQVENEAKCEPPLSDEEVRGIANSIGSYPPGGSGGPPGGAEEPPRGSDFNPEEFGWRPRPRIDAGCGDLPKMAQEAWDAIQQANEPPQYFRHAGIPSRIERDDEDRPIIRALTESRMRYAVVRAADWFKWKKDEQIPAWPPKELIADLLATPDPDLPVLHRIVCAPVFAEDGTLQTEPGYSPANRTFYVPTPGFELPDVPDNPTPAQIVEARALLADDLLGDFPFVSPADKAHTLAAIILPFVREMIRGPTPLHIIEKPSPGTGATLMTDLLTYPALGSPVAMMTEAKDEDEWRKRLLAKLRSGPSVVVIDNLRRRLDSAALSSAITSYPMWEDRQLGVSEIIRAPVHCLWLVTGNNPGLSNEMARRGVRCRLDAKQDKPWLRTEFRHKDIREWAAKNRGRLVAAILTLVQAWLRAGRPPGDKILGMFEAWARTLGGILNVVGVQGFLENLDDLYDRTDAEGAAWRAFIVSWYDRYGISEQTIADLFPLAVEIGELRLGDGKEQSQKTRLGLLLREQQDRTYQIEEKEGGPRIDVKVEHSGKVRRTNKWRLQKPTV